MIVLIAMALPVAGALIVRSAAEPEERVILTSPIAVAPSKFIVEPSAAAAGTEEPENDPPSDTLYVCAHDGIAIPASKAQLKINGRSFNLCFFILNVSF